MLIETHNLILKLKQIIRKIEYLNIYTIFGRRQQISFIVFLFYFRDCNLHVNMDFKIEYDAEMKKKKKKLFVIVVLQWLFNHDESIERRIYL